ncbi:MAG: transcription-repair coupling factor, partial [Proteobacteria bacterium]|nr:transcription-repair coupling factor [Pseudomonadota bacterium]
MSERLPALLPQLDALALPRPGARLDLPKLPGSADALAITQLARGVAARRLLTVITASPLAAQRLQDEIAWFAPELHVHLLPDWETLPYDTFSPHQDLISERLATLYAVSRGQCEVLLTAATTALTRLAPPSFLAAHTFFLKKGERLELDKLRAQLMLGGYQHVTQVVAPGEFSVRGGLIDLFPMGAALPYRIDLLDEEIESIRTFDADSQRTLYPVAEIRTLPAREFPLDEAGRTQFRLRCRETFEGDASRVALYKDVSNGIAPAGIEYYLPLFFEQTSTLFDYLPQDVVLLQHHDVPAAIAEFWRDTRERYRMMGGDRARPLLPPQDLFLSEEQFFLAAGAFPRLQLSATDSADNATDLAQPPPQVAVDRRADDPLAALKAFLAGFPGRVLLLAESAGRRETIREYLAEYGLSVSPCKDFASFVASSESFMLGEAPLSDGFLLPGNGLALITENELYAATARPRSGMGRRSDAHRSNLEGWLRDLSELKIGDPVVHEL